MNEQYSKAMVETFTNPLKWAQSFLMNPAEPGAPFVPTDYQAEVFNNTRKYKNMILLWGRQSGKSVVLCADTLYWTVAYPLVQLLEGKQGEQKPVKVLIATPYESQIKLLWETYTALIGDSPLLKGQVEKIRTSDFEITFKNGSAIQGHTIGISSSNRGVSLRGQRADVIFLDEMDFIPKDIIEQVIMPIWTGNPDSMLRISSTPSGKRELFYKWFTEAKDNGWFSSRVCSWHPSNTRWISAEKAALLGKPITDSTEFQAKAITPLETYLREYGAEFGEEFGGVYKHTFINRSLVKYSRTIDLSDSDKFDPRFEQNNQHKYIMGVDWNSYKNGGQIVIVEFCNTPTYSIYYDDDLKQDVTIDFTGRYRLFYRRGIKSVEATQRLTRMEIINLLTRLKIDYVYVDYGAGDTNIEELSLYGKAHPELSLSSKLHVIDAGAVVEHFDPLLGKTVKKRNKSLMVNFSALYLEEGLFVLPKEEDTDTRLIGQMRSYAIKNITTRGEYSYEGPDHLLDAFNLAIYGFQQNFGGLLSSRVKLPIIGMNTPRLNVFPLRQQETNSTIFSNSKKFDDPERELNTQRLNKPKRIDMPKIGSRSNLNIRKSYNSSLGNFIKSRRGSF